MKNIKLGETTYNGVDYVSVPSNDGTNASFEDESNLTATRTYDVSENGTVTLTPPSGASGVSKYIINVNVASSAATQTCPTCSGAGTITESCDFCGSSGTITRSCDSCGGSGMMETPCSICGGSGMISGGMDEQGNPIEEPCGCGGGMVVESCGACGGSGSFSEPCGACGGNGQMSHTCPHCYGSGVIPKP